MVRSVGGLGWAIGMDGWWVAGFLSACNESRGWEILMMKGVCNAKRRDERGGGGANEA